jgi:DNA-binding PadR family transcriptional regulator
MDVKTLCLGVLSLGDASGYEIKKLFEDAFSHFYVAGYGSIYPALAELIGEGMVTCTDVEQEKRPAKKVYRLTEAGQRYFREALAATYPTHRVRSDFLVQMVFAHLLRPAQLAAILDQREADIVVELAHIAHCESRESGLSPGVLFTTGYARAVLGAGLDYIRNHRQAVLVPPQEKDPPS